MKTNLITALLLTLVLGTFQIAEAQSPERQKVQIHKQKIFAKSNLIVKFVSLIEDSRCPEGANCVWAGNAKIKIEAGKSGKKETFEVNTTLGPKAATYNGYVIELVSLMPVPRENIRINRNGYVATFAVSRLAR